MNKIFSVAIIVGIVVGVVAISALLLNNDMIVLSVNKSKEISTNNAINSATYKSSDNAKHYAVNLSDSAVSSSHT
jgi:hypothetical protein